MQHSTRAMGCGAALTLLFISSPALADDTVQGPAAAPAGAAPSATVDESFRMPSPIAAAAEHQAGTGWEVTVTPYIWFSGLNGEIGMFPGVQPVDVDISFGDVLENLKIAGMVALGVRKDRFVALADIAYIDVGTSRDVGIRDPSFASIDLDTQTFTSTLAGGYRAVDQGPMFVDILAGARITSVDTELELIGPARTLIGESNETWVDPVIGARVHAPIGGNWALALYGDVGGFGVSSDMTWQLLGTVQVAVGRNWRIAAGWRHYEVDYQNGAFIYDVAMSGPIVGASFDF
jgi:hypothetical protein